MKELPANAKQVFQGEIFEVWQWTQRMYDGSTMTFECLRRPDTVCVIAAVGDKIMLQKQEQPNQPKPFFTLPGGRAEAGETPLQAIKREFLEETGYVSDKWIHWREDSPWSKMVWTLHNFIARGCQKVQAPQLDSGEKIELQLIRFDELLALADNPDFRDHELKLSLYKARLDPAFRAELHQQIFG